MCEALPGKPGVPPPRAHLLRVRPRARIAMIRGQVARMSRKARAEEAPKCPCRNFQPAALRCRPAVCVALCTGRMAELSFAVP